MIYKRPSWLTRNKSKNKSLRNFILILLVVFFIIASIFIFFSKNSKNTTKVIKYLAKTEPVSIVNENTAKELDLNCTEVFVFTEFDESNPVRHDIFIYDSATKEKKKLTGVSKRERSNGNVLFNISPKFSSDGKTIYFTKKPKDNDNQNYFELCSMDTNGKNFVELFTMSKANFSISPDGTEIIYFGLDHKICAYKIGTDIHRSLSKNSLIYADYPMISPDGTKLYFLNSKSTVFVNIYKLDLNSPSEAEASGVALFATFEKVTGIELSADGNFFLINLGSSTFNIFDINNKKIIYTSSSDENSIIIGATFSSDGKSVYWARDYPYNNVTRFDLKEKKSSKVIVPNFKGRFISLRPSVKTTRQVFEPEELKKSEDSTKSVNSVHDPVNNSEIQLTGTENDSEILFHDYNRTYSSNGEFIAFCRSFKNVSTDTDKNWIYLMNKDGTNIREIDKINSCTNFFFSHNSERLLYKKSDGNFTMYNIKTGIYGI